MPMRQNLLHRGSSPHVRGALKQDVARLRTAGIIPACAGSTRSTTARSPGIRDHPRMCGEHQFVDGFPGGQKGSSPHVRGARTRRHGQRQRQGIIPACAGSTSCGSGLPLGSRDHPRMCGEHFLLLSLFAFAAGSSPHVRGAHVTAMVHHTSAGIIPACAGSTDIDAIKRLVAGDHPRMCGEHLDGDTLNNVASGSSPHVRGAPRPAHLSRPSNGIIPACAGSTSCGSGLPLGSRDHPRMCGEHLSTKNRASVSGDHPRMCGEHNPVVNTATGSAGSSPHVRGALFLCLVKTWPRGIIPACAGSTD